MTYPRSCIKAAIPSCAAGLAPEDGGEGTTAAHRERGGRT